MIIGIVGNYRKDDFFTIIDIIVKNFPEYILNQKFILCNDYFSNSSKNISNNVKTFDFDYVNENSDILIAIGGDGTILSTIRRMKDNLKPIFGIHIGGLGFLSSCDSINLINSIKLLLNKEYEIESRLMLEILFNNKTYIALNDVVIDKGISSRLIKLNVKIDSLLLNTYESDGLIVSTPTGSTAYSLSAGGPIVSYDVDAIALTPLSSHSLSARPIIINSNKNIYIDVENDNNHFAVTIDGQLRIDSDCDNIVSIKKFNKQIELIRIDSDYYSTLRKKMGWIGKIR